MYTGNDAGIPLIVHIAYQMMFAIITPALITGAFANRVTFKAYFLFLTGWLVFVYFPFVHMVWTPDGMLAKWGVLDFAGGIVVHNTAGSPPWLRSSMSAGGKWSRTCRTTFPSSPWGPACCGSVGTASTRVRSCGWTGHGLGLPQHGRRRLLCRGHLAAHGMEIAKQPKFVGLLTGLRRRPGHHHARRRVCVPQHRGDHRHPGRLDLLLRRRP